MVAIVGCTPDVLDLNPLTIEYNFVKVKGYVCVINPVCELLYVHSIQILLITNGNESTL